MTSRRLSRKRLLVLIYAVSLLLRLVYLWEARDNPFFAADNLGLDARYYDRRAVEILDEGLIGNDAYFMGPLYPHLLAAVYGVAGRNIEIVRILQAVLAAFVPVLLYRIGERVFRPTVALVAAVTAALYGPFIFYVGAILDTTIGVVLLVWILDRLTAPPGRRPGRHRFLTGFLFGLAVVSKGNAILFLPFALFGLAWGAGEKARRDLRAAALFLAGFLVVLGAVTARNVASSGEAVLITSNGGLNFYIGNGPESDGGYRCPKGLDVNEDPAGRALLAKQTGHPVSATGASRIWLERSLRWIAANPGKEAALLLRKLVFTFSSFEIPQIEIYPVEMRYSRVVTLLHIPFGVIVPLGLAGSVFCFRRRTFFLVAFLYSYAASIVLFFVVTRYRLPFVPVLILFASFLIVGAVDEARRGRWKRAGGRALILVPFFLLSNVNFYHVVPDLGFAESEFRLGLIAERDGDLEGAIDHYRRCAENEPNHALSRLNLGVLLARRGEKAEAERTLREAIRIDPEYPKAYLNLGNLLYREGRLAEGEEALRRAVTLDPNYGKAWFHLAALALIEGKPDAEEKARAAIGTLAPEDPTRALAGELLSRLQEMDVIGAWRAAHGRTRTLPSPVRDAVAAEILQDLPDTEAVYREAAAGGDPAALHMYGLFLLRRGDLARGAEVFERVRAAAPDMPYLEFALGVIAHGAGRMDEAREHFARETRNQPGFAPAWKNAAMLSAQAGRFDEAKRYAEGYVRAGGPEDPAIRSLLGSAPPGRR